MSSDSTESSKPKGGCIKTLLKTVAVLLLIFCLVPLALPKEVHLKNSIDIAATPAEVFALAGEQSQQTKWNTWYQMDPNATITVSGSGRDSTVDFASKQGTGKSTTVVYQPPTLAKFHIQMEKPLPGSFFTEIDIEPTATGSHVTWHYDQAKIAYIMRYTTLFMGKMVGDTNQKGLENLKALAEKKG